MTKQKTGEVLSANPMAKILVMVSTDRKQMTFLVADDAATDLAQVKPGDSVTVRSIGGDGRFIARAIGTG